MRRDLDHLSERKRRDLERALDLLLTEFAEALKTKLSAKRKQGRILKVVLFGSHARGDWVEDFKTGYRSDYDILVVVNSDEFTDSEYWERATEKFLPLTTSTQTRSALGLIVHSLAEINDHLARGRYFFIDILREGISLYEVEGYPFAKPQPLTSEGARQEAQGYFDFWFPSAAHFLDLAAISQSAGQLKEAAFLLHQATERLYHCVLLVLTLYTPKLHDIHVLRNRCEFLVGRLAEAWPRDSRRARRLFQKLRRAYVDARYSQHFMITPEELDWLHERVRFLHGLGRIACEERLRSS